MNVVTLIGNLATDVEVRDGLGWRMATFLLTVGRPSDNKADLVRIKVWDEHIGAVKFLAKGSRVGVNGRLRSSSWQDEQGKRRWSIEVEADGVQLLSPPDVPATSRAASCENSRDSRGASTRREIENT